MIYCKILVTLALISSGISSQRWHVFPVMGYMGGLVLNLRLVWGNGDMKRADRKWRGGRKNKSTHQLEILNATNEVGSVGPLTLNVHTICKWGEKKGFNGDIHTSQSFHVFKQPDSVMYYFVCCYLCWKDIFLLESNSIGMRVIGLRTFGALQGCLSKANITPQGNYVIVPLHLYTSEQY